MQAINSMFSKILTYKIVKYGLVGAVSTFIHFLFAFIYIYSINTSVFQSNVIGFLMAYVFSYLMQSKYVFEQGINIEKAVKYLIVQFSVLLAAIIISNLFESYNSYIKTVIVVILLPLITFIIHKFWTFKGHI